LEVFNPYHGIITMRIPAFEDITMMKDEITRRKEDEITLCEILRAHFCSIVQENVLKTSE